MPSLLGVFLNDSWMLGANLEQYYHYLGLLMNNVMVARDYFGIMPSLLGTIFE